MGTVGEYSFRKLFGGIWDKYKGKKADLFINYLVVGLAYLGSLFLVMFILMLFMGSSIGMMGNSFGGNYGFNFGSFIVFIIIIVIFSVLWGTAFLIHILRISELALKGKIEKFAEVFEVVKKKYFTMLKTLVGITITYIVILGITMIIAMVLAGIGSSLGGTGMLIVMPIVMIIFVVVVLLLVISVTPTIVLKYYDENIPFVDALRRSINFVQKNPGWVFKYIIVLIVIQFAASIIGAILSIIPFIGLLISLPFYLISYVAMYVPWIDLIANRKAIK